MSESKFTGEYEVTADGRVFSLSSNWRGYGAREMQKSLNSDGYLSVRLVLDGRRVRLAVHRLVAAGFLPDRPSPTHEVRHLDGDKENPQSSNLAWGTAADNAADRQRHGRTSRGPNHSGAVRSGQRASSNPYWRHNQ